MVKSKGDFLVQNKRARFDYEIEETFEAGMVLKGTEIKSLRQKKASLAESFAVVRGGEVWLTNMHISPYEHGNQFNHEETRARKLLLSRKEIDSLEGLIKVKGKTLVPMKVYLKNGKAKLLLGLGKGKKKHDKREDAKKKTMKREAEKALKDY